MTLQTDMRWIRDALDTAQSGGCAMWPHHWSTVIGSQVGNILRALLRERFELKMSAAQYERKVAALQAEIDGLHEVNQRLTDELEAES